MLWKTWDLPYAATVMSAALGREFIGFRETGARAWESNHS